MTEKLLQAINIGDFRLQNPAVFGPHRVNFPEGHLPGPKRIAYYEERAKNNVGMIIVENSMVLEGEYPYDWALNVFEKDAVAAYGKLAAAVHKYDTVVVGSLNHYGMQGDSSVTRKPLLAPSANVPGTTADEIPKVMDDDDIKALVNGFKVGAGVMKQAGLDGVEINAGQYSLLRQFLSGLTNFRGDAYGGSLENKCRLLVTVLNECRLLLGSDKILGLRMCADEYAPWGGIQPSEAKEMVAYITSKVKIDYIAFENGSIYSANMTMSGSNKPEDYAVAAALEAGSGAPETVKGVGGSLVTLASIEKALNDFHLVDLTRALIADPEFIVKVRDGRTKEITPCILCKEGCHTHANTNPVVACAMNPIAGEEYKYSPIKPFRRKNLAVVGSGPAGLSAALTALKTGHTVTLFEKTEKLGGHFAKFAENFSSDQPSKVLQYYLDNFADYEKKGDLQIKINHEFTADMAKDFDAVAVAAGANYFNGAFKGDSQVISLDDILDGNIPAGGRAVVEDALGDNRAVTACRMLKKAGYNVVLVTKNAYHASKLVKIGEFADWYGEMAGLGIDDYTNSYVGYAGKDKVEIINKYNEEITALAGADLAVKIETPKVEQGLWEAIKTINVPKILLGDAVAPRNLQAAIREGYQAIKELR